MVTTGEIAHSHKPECKKQFWSTVILEVVKPDKPSAQKT